VAAVHARAAPCSGEEALRLVSVGEEQDRDERARDGRRRCRAVRRECPARVVADRLEAQPYGNRDRISDRSAAEAAKLARRIDRLGDKRVVACRRRRHLRFPGEQDQPDAHTARHFLEERVDRLLRCQETRRLHVDRLHRAGDVEHEYDRGLVARHQRARTRT
jgi:hypothetical protein